MKSNSPGRKEKIFKWSIVGLFLLLSILFLSRALFLPEGRLLGGHDIRGLFYPWSTFAQEELKQGRLPLWDPYQFSGYPFIGNPQVALFYPPAWLMHLLPHNIGISVYVLFHLWLAGMGMVFFVRKMKGRWLGAILAGITFAFSGYAAARIESGHIGLLATNAWLPWILLACVWSIRRRDVRSAILAGIPFGMVILAGHIASLLYIGIIWLALIGYIGVTEGRWKHILKQVSLSGVFGLALSAIQLLPFLKLTMLSTRAVGTLTEYGFRWSFPPMHLIALIIPNYFGEPVSRTYWGGENFQELTYYVGILPLLAIALSIKKPTRLSRLYIGLMILGFLLAFGSYGFLYRLAVLLPPFRIIRVPARAAFLFVFSASALLCEVFTTWRNAPKDDQVLDLRPWIKKVLIISALLCTIGLIVTGAVMTASHPSPTSPRLWYQAGGWVWALILFIGGGGLLLYYLKRSSHNHVRRKMAAAGLIALVIADLWFFAYKLVRSETAAPAKFWIDTAQAITNSPQRVLPLNADLSIQNDGEILRIKSVLGYNTLEVSAYRDFARVNENPRSTVYDVLGVEYVLSPTPLKSVFTEGALPLQLVTSTDSVWIYRRPRVMPIARLVYRSEIIIDPSQAKARICEPDFDPATIVILDKQPPSDVGPPPEMPGTADIIKEHPGYWLIETQSTAASMLILSETFYPGWRVTVDGKPASPFTAYSAIKAVWVPPGKHQVEWVFDPVSYKIGAIVTLLALIVSAIAGINMWSKTKQKGLSTK